MKFYWQLKCASFREVASDRITFFIEAFVTALSSLIFFSLWCLFFSNFKSVGGWELHQMGYLFAILTGSYGISVLFFGGTKQLARLILSSALDTFLLRPKSPLIYIGLSWTMPRGVGDIATSLFLTAVYGFGDIQVTLLLLLGIACGTLVLTSCRILANSALFFFGSVEDVTKKYMDSILLFSYYPAHIYTGTLKVLMYTVLPAGLISTLPVALICDFSILKVCFLIGSTALFCAVTRWLFYKGLERYESGR